MGSSNSYLWKFENVSKNGLSQARLTDVSLEIHSGITALLGTSGAGKSSLINLMSNMEVVDQGQLSKGPQITDADFPFYIVPQDYGLWPQMNVENHLLKSMPKADTSKASHILKKLNLEHKKHEYPEFLSQGECSRLSIARALATESPILLMDEPLANVDSAGKAAYWEFIIEEKK